ncbi:MAG: N-acetylmuramoyl-L-alanine amidase [Firmicutes bacterium]|nr:N-acetylmuramoyl-L-alanine amidase [Bacillota bacterium]
MFVVLRRRRIVIILLLLIAGEICLTTFLCVKQFASGKESLIDFTVVIDAGHGGIDGGVVSSDGVRESSLNLAYSKELGAIFERGGFNVTYTRKTEDGLYGLPTKGFKSRDMKARKEIIDSTRPNMVISIHMNKFSGSYRSGLQVFYQEGKSDGQILAESIQRVFNDGTGSRFESIAGDYYICRETDCPSVIVECGFLSNEREAALLQTDEYRETICNYIYSGVMLYLYASD